MYHLMERVVWTRLSAVGVVRYVATEKNVQFNVRVAIGTHCVMLSVILMHKIYIACIFVYLRFVQKKKHRMLVGIIYLIFRVL